MSYLYDEISAKEREELAGHLDACDECRAQVAIWRGASAALDQWSMPARRNARRASTAARWAVAAAVAALAIAGGARLITLNHEVKSLRAEIADRAAESARAEAQTLMAAAAQRWDQQRAADRQALLGVLQQLSARQAQDYASLRKELETVALFSEAGLQRAENQISSLAVTPTSFSDQK